ncbi:MAG: imidazoleglycerol-phosphate dehydratase HisB [Candidatus Latescibacteria bacterium]|nr:imidazoleglycerol-phosphate dehydratase HisB [Candidatus Latescibacterota bacterium]
MKGKRCASVRRATRETQIELQFCLDGEGSYEISTGIGFFDHMLQLFAQHGFFDLKLSCQGDLEVDAHHCVEDVGICLGQAIDKALGDRSGICRYGTSYVPMDESLGRAVVDLSGRPFLVFDARFKLAKVGQFDTELVREFFQAVANNGKLTLHLDLLRSSNTHHSIEALFKAFGRALDQASSFDARVKDVLSTKGEL